MVRLGAIIAGLILAVMAAAPASANTIKTFNLNGVTFNDGGTATGSFTLDLTTHTIVSSAIFTSFKITPLDWLFGLASYKTTTRSFDGVPAEAQVAFQNAEPETVTELIFQVGVTKTF